MDTIERILQDGRRLTIREAQPEDAAAVVNHFAAVYAESSFLTGGPGEFERGVPEQEQLIRAC